MKTKIICYQCKKEIINTSDFSTGYGIDKDNNKICYSCCGENDKKQLEETGKLFGYFTINKGNCYGTFSNWPGSFKKESCYFRQSYHNICGKNGRTDFWFIHNNKQYHGVNISKQGSNECAKVKRVKS